MADYKRKVSAKSRKQKLLAESHDVMRQKLQFGKALQGINEVEEWLVEQMGNSEIDHGQLAAARIYLDSKWRRINKILPSLAQASIDVNVNTTLAKQLEESRGRVIDLKPVGRTATGG